MSLNAGSFQFCSVGGTYQYALPVLWQPPMELPISSLVGLIVQKPLGPS